jgi:hypothetical protein
VEVVQQLCSFPYLYGSTAGGALAESQGGKEDELLEFAKALGHGVFTKLWGK